MYITEWSSIGGKSRSAGGSWVKTAMWHSSSLSCDLQYGNRYDSASGGGAGVPDCMFTILYVPRRPVLQILALGCGDSLPGETPPIIGYTFPPDLRLCQ